VVIRVCLSEFRGNRGTLWKDLPTVASYKPGGDENYTTNDAHHSAGTASWTGQECVHRMCRTISCRCSCWVGSPIAGDLRYDTSHRVHTEMHSAEVQANTARNVNQTDGINNSVVLNSERRALCAGTARCGAAQGPGNPVIGSCVYS